MNSKDGDEKDEEGQAKDKNISLYLKSMEEESTDKCFVLLEISVCYWIRSVARPLPPRLARSED
jgi:hypothetical protein